MLTMNKVLEIGTKKIKGLLEDWREGKRTLEELNKEIPELSGKDEEQTLYRTVGAFINSDFSLVESLIHELTTKEEKAVDTVGMIGERTGAFTIVGKKKIKRSFSEDCWSSYDAGGELITQRSDYECPSVQWAFAEWVVEPNKGDHTEHFAYGEWLEVEYVNFHERVSEKEIFGIYYFLELTLKESGMKVPKLYVDGSLLKDFRQKKLKYSREWSGDWMSRIFNSAECEEEEAFLGLSSLIPANSKVSLWD